MDRAEFDQFAEEYTRILAGEISASGETPDFFAEYKIADARRWCDAVAHQPRRILDFGSGVGSSIQYFRKYFPSAELICADISQRSLDCANERFGKEHRSVLIEGNQLPLEPSICDLVFTACVYHHIDHSEHTHWLGECLRVSRPDAMLVVFEHNPWNPMTVRVVNSCPFDRNARLIPSPQMKRSAADAGWERLARRYRLFFPRLLSKVRPVENCIAWLPLGAQYAIVGRKGAQS